MTAATFFCDRRIAVWRYATRKVLSGESDPAELTGEATSSSESALSESESLWPRSRYWKFLAFSWCATWQKQIGVELFGNFCRQKSLRSFHRCVGRLCEKCSLVRTDRLLAVKLVRLKGQTPPNLRRKAEIAVRRRPCLPEDKMGVTAYTAK